MSEHASQAEVSWRTPLWLGLITLAAGALLWAIYVAVRVPTEAARRAAELSELQKVLPPTRHDNDLLADSFVLDPAQPVFAQQELLGLSTARRAYRATTDSQASAVILPLETALGYRGAIVMLIGIDTNGEITGVRAVQHNETPGLGDRIDLDKSRWILSFDSRSLTNTDPRLWGVKKDGGEFDQFVGATITPRVVVNAVRKALEFFELNREALLVSTAPETPQ